MLELAVMVGLQGSGKSTLVASRFAATHRVVSKDHWPNARRRELRQRRVVAELLASGSSVVVDNTNPSSADRAPLIELAHAHGAIAVAVLVDTPLEVCLERNQRRAEGRVPLVGILAAAKRFEPPSTSEGFDRVDVVRWYGRAV